MNDYTLQQEFSDLTWFHASAMTLIAGMPVTVRGAGKFSIGEKLNKKPSIECYD